MVISDILNENNAIQKILQDKYISFIYFAASKQTFYITGISKNSRILNYFNSELKKIFPKERFNVLSYTDEYNKDQQELGKILAYPDTIKIVSNILITDEVLPPTPQVSTQSASSAQKISSSTKSTAPTYTGLSQKFASKENLVPPPPKKSKTLSQTSIDLTGENDSITSLLTSTTSTAIKSTQLVGDTLLRQESAPNQALENLTKAIALELTNKYLIAVAKIEKNKRIQSLLIDISNFKEVSVNGISELMSLNIIAITQFLLSNSPNINIIPITDLYTYLTTVRKISMPQNLTYNTRDSLPSSVNNLMAILNPLFEIDETDFKDIAKNQMIFIKITNKLDLTEDEKEFLKTSNILDMQNLYDMYFPDVSLEQNPSHNVGFG